ncbi:DENN domain and WD repeat-containing protein SCD1 [Cardamine amara subsp. amara]|uniref:DENN domain and WD repeat-containing protein SCD1 n=1 Tax=Cardamine amara subsp. amara TaxID=228776 RepID=A0ABD0ZMV4_CARAN
MAWKKITHAPFEVGESSDGGRVSQDAMSILPKSTMEPEIIITIAEPEVEESATSYIYDRFPANVWSEELEENRKQILAASSRALESNGRHSPSSPPWKNTKEDSFSSRERAVSVPCYLVAHAWLETNQCDIKRRIDSEIN